MSAERAAATTAPAAASPTSRCRSTASSAARGCRRTAGVVGVLASSWQRRFALVSRRLDLARRFLLRPHDRRHRRRPDRERGPLERDSAVWRRCRRRDGRPGHDDERRAAGLDEHDARRPVADDHDRAAPDRARHGHVTDRDDPDAAEPERPRDLAGRQERLHERPRVAAGQHGRAVARPARAAGRSGRASAEVGVLVSSQYSSLHPGYFVVFQRIYATQAEAHGGPRGGPRQGLPGAYQTRVTR